MIHADIAGLRGAEQWVARGSPSRIAAVCVAATFLEAVFYGVLAPLLPGLKHELGLSKGGAGVLVASYMIGMLAATPPARYALLHVRAQSAVVASLLALAGSTVGFAVAHSAAAVVALRTVQGMAGGVACMAALAWWLEVVPEERRGRAVGNTLAATFAGAAVGPLLGAVVIALGRVTALGAISALSVAVAVVAARSRSVLPQRSQVPPAERPPVWALLSPSSLAVLALLGVGAMGMGARFVLVPLELAAEGVIGVGIAATFGGISVVMAVMAVLVGRAVERRGPAGLIISGAAISAVLLCLQAAADGATSTAAAAITVGVGLQMITTASVVQLIEDGDRIGVDTGTSWAYVNICWTGGYLLGSLLSSWVSQQSSDAVAWALLAALCVAAGAGFAIGRGVREVR